MYHNQLDRADFLQIKTITKNISLLLKRDKTRFNSNI